MQTAQIGSEFRPDAGSRVLVVEDDLPLAQLLRQQLEAKSYAVTVAHDGDTAKLKLEDGRFDLVILDLNLPKLDGVSLLRLVRPSLPRLPVLVLTARNRVEDRALSLDTGADDCMIKPFSFVELHARVRALLRRNSGPISKVSQVADLLLDREQHRVERNGRRIELTAREFDVLELLMRNAGRPVSRTVLMEEVWKLPFDPSTNVVDVYVKYTQSGNTVLGMVQNAESVLSSVISEVSQAVSVGVEGANGTLSDANRQTLAQQVTGTLQSVVSQANAAYGGVYLFAGTASTTIPFTASSSSPSGYQYNGNSHVNSMAIGDGYQIQTNLPGDHLFQQSGNDLVGSLQQLVTALQGGDTTVIGSATNQLRQALDYLTQQRAFYGNVESQINTQETFLQNESVSIKSQENSLVGVDLATAATNLSRAQTATEATMAAAARVLQQSLLDYLK